MLLPDIPGFAKLTGRSSLSAVLLGPRDSGKSDAPRKTLDELIDGKSVSNQRLLRLAQAVADHRADEASPSFLKQFEKELIANDTQFAKETDQHDVSLLIWDTLSVLCEPYFPETANTLKMLSARSRDLHKTLCAVGPSVLADTVRHNPEATDWDRTVANYLANPQTQTKALQLLQAHSLALLALMYTFEATVKHSGCRDEGTQQLFKLFAVEHFKVRPGISYANALRRMLAASGHTQTQAIDIAFGSGENKRRGIQSQLAGDLYPPLHVVESAITNLQRHCSLKDASRRHTGLFLCLTVSRTFNWLQKAGIKDPDLPFQHAFDLVLARAEAGPDNT